MISVTFHIKIKTLCQVSWWQGPDDVQTTNLQTGNIWHNPHWCQFCVRSLSTAISFVQWLNLCLMYYMYTW